MPLSEADFLDRIRNRAQRLKNPSQRAPDRETNLNNADNIERQLQEDEYQIWGCMIYRSMYESDEEWVEFMPRLRYYIEDTLRFDNALDMQQSLNYRVFEDGDHFDRLHPSTVLESCL